MDHYDPAEHPPIYIECGESAERKPRPKKQTTKWGKYSDLPDNVCEALQGFRGSLRDIK